MTIETKFNIGQEVYMHDVDSNGAIRKFVHSIKVEVFQTSSGIDSATKYKLIPGHMWVPNFHLFATPEEVAVAVERWRKL